MLCSSTRKPPNKSRWRSSPNIQTLIALLPQCQLLNVVVFDFMNMAIRLKLFESLAFNCFISFVQVIKYENIDVSTVVDSNQVLVRWLASPIHPSDINLIENVYWKKRKVPAFVQSECVGSVEKVSYLLSTLLYNTGNYFAF